MIIIPYNHDRMQFQRLPFFTIGLILLNLIIFVFTFFEEPKTREAIYSKGEEIIRFYAKHPNLDLPKEIAAKISPEWQTQILTEQKFLKTVEPDETQIPVDPEAQEHLNKLIEEFEETRSLHFYRKYGYTPKSGGFFSIISAMFIHGGIFHLVFNMLFLWLAGGVLEDLWGRAVFPGFYLLGGIVATMAHHFAYPESTEPLIGASGAIAALMGAFMIRLYNTRIKLFYAIFFGVRFRHGTFYSPAYIILPIWLLQQVWDYYLYSSFSDVAFLAHIGGFAFGAGIAVLLKVSQIEKKLIAPLVEKKSELLDENLAIGEENLLKGDVEKAAHNLRMVLAKNPDDPMAHSQLCRAYFLQSKKRVALVEMNRAVKLFLKSEYIDNAIDFYKEVTDEFINAVLEPSLQLEMAMILEEKEEYIQAGSAYQKLILHYLPQTETVDHPEVIKALMNYGDVCINHLMQPLDAFTAYNRLLGFSDYLSKEQVEALKEKAQQAGKAAQDQPHEPGKCPKNTSKNNPDKMVKKNKKAEPDSLLNKKIKLVEQITTPPKYEVTSLIPQETGNIGPVDNGIDLRLLSQKKLYFSDINYICVFQFTEQTDILYADIFLAGESRPYRVLSSQVTYRKFLSNLSPILLTNFHKFVLYLISHMDSVFLDKKTLNYLKTKVPTKFPTQDHVKQHEKPIWRKLKGKVKIGCQKCHEAYWLDGEKVPKNGGKTKCKKCGQVLKIKPLRENTTEIPNQNQIQMKDQYSGLKFRAPDLHT